jgi:hypothetical protein
MVKMEKSLIIAFSLFVISSAQAQVLKESTTDKSSYSYGEEIIVTYRITNNGDDPVTYQGTSTFSAYPTEFSGVDISPKYTTTDELRDTLWPGEYLQNVWSFNPKELGLPNQDGIQFIVLSMFGIADTVQFEAPKYLGGKVGVYFNAQKVDSIEADSILSSIGAEINEGAFPGYYFTVEGYRIDSLASKWLNDEIISEAYLYEFGIQNSGGSRTANDFDEFPATFKLSQNYPNPFNPTTTIQYSLIKPDYVSLNIFDSKGALVVELLNRWMGEGTYSEVFDASGLASGVYFYRLRVGDKTAVRTMTLIK